MSRIKAIIYTSTIEENNLIFDNDDIVAISTNSKCIENENLPEFDIFPNSGTLTVKDRNLIIYNKALKGLFDNYEYKVQFFLEDKIFASHIINQRPSYDYEAKTCTFYLGNALDSLNSLSFNPYAYPLKSQNLNEVFKNVLSSIFEITDNDYKELTSDYWGTIETFSNLTFYEYFNKINISYPYISQTIAREALKTILLIAQCGMYLDKSNKLKLIRLDGYSNSSYEEYYNNVYKIEPKQTKKSFIPSVVLNNRFNKFNLDYYLPKLNVSVNSPIYNFIGNSEILGDYLNIANGFYIVSDFEEKATTNNDGNGTYYQYLNDTEPVESSKYYIRCAQVRLKKYYTYSQHNLQESIFQNNNLKEVVSLIKEWENDSNGNPQVVVTCKKISKKSKQAFTAHDLTWGKFTTFGEATTIEESKDFETFNLFELTKNFSVNIKDIKNDKEITLNNIKITIPATNNSDITYTNDLENIPDNYKNLYVFSWAILSGFQVEILTGSTISERSTNKNAYTIGTDYGIKEIIDYIPVKVELTYNGTVKEIIFDKNSTSAQANNSQLLNYTLQSNLELNQDTSTFNNTKNTKDTILNNLLNTFNSGLHSGTISTIAVDYDTYLPTDTSEIGRYKERQLFEIGDKVMPFRNDAIIKRENQPVVFQVIDVETFNEGGATFQNLVLREIKRPPAN